MQVSDLLLISFANFESWETDETQGNICICAGLSGKDIIHFSYPFLVIYLTISQTFEFEPHKHQY